MFISFYSPENLPWKSAVVDRIRPAIYRLVPGDELSGFST